MAVGYLQIGCAILDYIYTWSLKSVYHVSVAGAKDVAVEILPEHELASTPRALDVEAECSLYCIKRQS